MARLEILLSPLSALGRQAIFMILELGRISIFFFKGIYLIFSLPLAISKIVQQVYFIGTKSLVVIFLTGAFTGMVLGLQGYYVLVKYGATGSLGSAVALSLVREMGPVLSAIMVVARAGSAMTAEIGIMRIAEQIDALETTRKLISKMINSIISEFLILNY